MKKWSITQYFSKLLPNGQAFPCNDRQNPGTGEYDIDFTGLSRLEQDHGDEFVPLQWVALFILKYIHLLAYESLVAGLFLTKHHGLPVAPDCNGADIPVSSISPNRIAFPSSISHHFLTRFVVELVPCDRKYTFCLAFLLVVSFW